MEMVLLCAFVVVAVIIGLALNANAKAKEEARRKRRERILQKYGPGPVAEKILSQTVWVGETAEQLRDSLDAPADIDQKVLKTKKKEIWKYAHKGGNRYGLRITLDNGVVAGWDEKL